MKQLETLDRLRPLIASVPGIRGALLIGSFARGNPKWNSDLDLSFWVDEWFDPQGFISKVRDTFAGVFQYGLHSSRRGHLALYFADRPKADIGLYDTLSGLDRNVLGSEIPDIGAAVLWDPSQLLQAHLSRITQGQAPGGIGGYAAEVGRLADTFLYEFEQCSEAHRRSDSYKSYFFYNIALHAAIQIRYLARGGRSFHFLPKNFAACMLTREEDHAFRELRGSLYLPEIHEAKRRLIDFFLEGLRESQAVDAARIAEMERFCGFICQRDRLWNFRDLADINPRLKRGRIFRASSLTRYQHEPFFPGFLAGQRIGKVLDLRDDDELARNPYAPGSLGAARHIRLPIDPRRQSEHFQAHYHQGNHKEIAYRYFAVECKAQIRQLFEILAEPDDTAAVIHCHAGKDRTGVLVTLIHLLSGADEETVLMEYLASEMDSDPALLQVFREVVDQAGSVRDYLLSCGIAPATLDAFLAQYRNHPPA